MSLLLLFGQRPGAALAATGAGSATGSATALNQTQPLAATGAGTATGTPATLGAAGADLAATGAGLADTAGTYGDETYGLTYGTGPVLSLTAALAATGAGQATGTATIFRPSATAQVATVPGGRGGVAATAGGAAARQVLAGGRRG